MRTNKFRASTWSDATASALGLYNSVQEPDGLFSFSFNPFSALNLESGAILTKNVYSRLSQMRHNSLEMSLATITQHFSRLSSQKYLGTAESSSSVASNALRSEEKDVTYSYPGNVHLAQIDPPNSCENWIVPQKKAMVRRTLEVSESVMEGFLGSIRATSATVLQSPRQTADLTPYREQDQHEYKTSYTISPAPWLVRLGFHYGFHLGFLSSTQGWKNTLKTFCPVPDDALIFEFCRQGNVSAVRRLLSKGHASVRDTDSRGYTPLHVSLINEPNPPRYIKRFDKLKPLTLAPSLLRRVIIQSFVDSLRVLEQIQLHSHTTHGKLARRYHAPFRQREMLT